MYRLNFHLAVSLDEFVGDMYTRRQYMYLRAAHPYQGNHGGAMRYEFATALEEYMSDVESVQQFLHNTGFLWNQVSFGCSMIIIHHHRITFPWENIGVQVEELKEEII